jgi:transposase-like protein/IS1 family transposase
MIVAVCNHENRKKFGKTKAGTPRFRCCDCGKCFTESTDTLSGMRIGLDRAERIIEMLLEGLSVSTVARLTGTKAHTIIDLMVLIGERCESYMRSAHRNLTVDSIQADETWSYIGLKQKTAHRLGRNTARLGDCYAYTAIDRESKLMVTWHFGKRDQVNTDYFCRKLAVAIEGRFKLSTDGFHAYEPAVNWHLFQRTDYGQVIKVFGMVADDPHHFGSPSIISQRKKRICGTVQHDEICTSHCERLNGTIRNYVKRTARLTYAFSKKWENHQTALALFFMAYNYCKPHKSLKKQTPAMAHGIADHKWTVRELIENVSSNT